MVAPVQTTFIVDILDPCDLTVLTLPGLLDFSITVFEVGFPQTFAPATDSSATTIGTVDLCGPRIYEIVEPEPQNFMTITSPADGLDYLSPWSLDALSTDLIDVGVWTITLRATL